MLSYFTAAKSPKITLLDMAMEQGLAWPTTGTIFRSLSIEDYKDTEI